MTDLRRPASLPPKRSGVHSMLVGASVALKVAYRSSGIIPRRGDFRKSSLGLSTFDYCDGFHSQGPVGWKA